MAGDGTSSGAISFGAGRATKDDEIDHAAGIMLVKKTGEYVSEGDTVAVLYTNDTSRIEAAEAELLAAIEYGDEKPEISPLIYKTVC